MADTSNSRPGRLRAQGVVDVDKGWAWAVCFGTFLWNLIVGGTSKIHGLLFIGYLELFDQGETATGWFSFSYGVMLVIVAPVGGYLSDRLTHTQSRLMITICSIVASLFMALAGYMPSLPLTTTTFVILGLIMGIADPIALSLLAKYFEKNRTIAYCLGFSGSSAGTILIPLLFSGTDDLFGFRGTILMLAGVWLHIVFLPAVSWPIKTETSLELSTSAERDTPTGIENKAYERDIENKWGDVQIKSEQSGREVSGSRANVKLDNPVFEMIDPTAVNGVRLEENTTRSMIANTKDQKNNDAIHVPSSASMTLSSTCKPCAEIIVMLRNFGNFFKSSGVTLLLLCLFIGFFTYYGSFFLIPLLAKEINLTTETTAYIFIVASLMEPIARVIIGILVDKAGVSKATILLVTFAVTGIVGLVVSYVLRSYLLFVYAAVVGGFGGAVICLGIPMIVDCVSDNQKGTSSGMFLCVLGLGSALVPVILGYVKAQYGTYAHCLRANSATFFLGILLYLCNFLFTKLRQCILSGKLNITG